MSADTAKDRADWLLDAIATATQDRRFMRGDGQYDPVIGEAVLLNAEKAILTALAAERRKVALLREALAEVDSADTWVAALAIARAALRETGDA